MSARPFVSLRHLTGADERAAEDSPARLFLPENEAEQGEENDGFCPPSPSLRRDGDQCWDTGGGADAGTRKDTGKGKGKRKRLEEDPYAYATGDQAQSGKGHDRGAEPELLPRPMRRDDYLVSHAYDAIEFGDLRSFIQHKRQKLKVQQGALIEQERHFLQHQQSKGAPSSSAFPNGVIPDRPYAPVFAGCHIYIDGLTQAAPFLELRRLIVLHGGEFYTFLDRKTQITHIVASSLTPKKRIEFRDYRVVSENWVLDSVAQGVKQDWRKYQHQSHPDVPFAQGGRDHPDAATAQSQGSQWIARLRQNRARQASQVPSRFEKRHDPAHVSLSNSVSHESTSLPKSTSLSTSTTILAPSFQNKATHIPEPSISATSKAFLSEAPSILPEQSNPWGEPTRQTKIVSFEPCVPSLPHASSESTHRLSVPDGPLKRSRSPSTSSSSSLLRSSPVPPDLGSGARTPVPLASTPLRQGGTSAAHSTVLASDSPSPPTSVSPVPEEGVGILPPKATFETSTQATQEAVSNTVFSATSEAVHQVALDPSADDEDERPATIGPHSILQPTQRRQQAAAAVRRDDVHVPYAASASNEHAARLLASSSWRERNTATSGEFLKGFFAKSRLHHLSSWKTQMRDMVAEAMRESGREMGSKDLPRGVRRVIMHIDVCLLSGSDCPPLLCLCPLVLI